MRRLLILLLFASAVFGQGGGTSNNGRVMTGTLATRPANCQPGDQYNTTDGNGNFTCFPANTWNSMAGSGVSAGVPLQKGNGSGGFSNSSATDDANGVHFHGPNPYVDITAFGARAVNPNIAPATTGITATCNSVTNPNQVTLSSASTFQNGDGVVLYQCGPPHSMVTPTAPTVTPVVARAGTGTQITAPGPTGATTYNYYLIARDRNGGLTAPSLVGSTTTGAASLGAQTVNITSISQSNQTVTVTTSAAHGFNVGCSITTCGEVLINSANGLSDITFFGWYSVVSAVDTTHFTFQRPGDTRLGATTSATGGAAIYYNANKVTWPNTVGSVETAVYSDRAVSGTCAFIGLSFPNDSTFTETEFDDFGSPMMDNMPRPAIFPASFSCASPPLATSDSLSTTITSGAGTVNLTLAANAGSSSSGNPIRFDDGPALLAANAAGVTGNCVLDIPFDASGNSYVINSWTSLTLSKCGVTQNGTLYLNDTLEVIPGSGTNSIYWSGGYPASGVVGPGAWASLPQITVNTAWPGLMFDATNGLHVSGLQFVSVPQNGALELLTGPGFNQKFDWIAFNSGSGSTDYMSMGWQSRSANGAGASNVTADYVTFAPGGGSVGVSHTPALFARGTATQGPGTWTIPDAYFLHRGMLYNGGAKISLGVNGVGYINGGGTPQLTTYAPSAVNGPTVEMGNIVLDTFANPCLAALPNAANSTVVTFDNSLCSPSSNVPGLSGNTVVIQGAKDIKAQGQVGVQAGAVTDSLFGFSNNYVQNLNNAQIMIGQDYSVAVQGSTPVLSSCPVSAGGSLSVGTHTFQVVPFWWNSNNGIFSNTCTAVTSTGNQTVTLNWNLIPGNPQLIRFYDGGTGQRISSQTGLPTATSAVISSETIAGGTGDAFPTGGPTMMLPGVQGIATPKLTLAGTPVSSAPISTWDGVTFGTTNTGSIVAFTPDQAITVTAIDYSLPAGQTLGATCVTQPTVRVSDGTTIGAQLTLTNSQASGALTGLSLNYPAGDNTLRIEVAVASAGCGTQWGNVNLVAHYRMQ